MRTSTTCPRCGGCLTALERHETADGPWLAQRCLACGCQLDALVLQHRRRPPSEPYGHATLPIYRQRKTHDGRRLQRDGEDLA